MKRLLLLSAISSCLAVACEPAPGPAVRSPDCPDQPPRSGEACSAGGHVCAYDANAHHACATIASCGFGVGEPSATWFTSPPAAICGGRSPTCPATFTSRAVGAACSVGAPASCDFPQGRCACLPCGEDTTTGQGVWACEAWDQPTGLYPPVWRRDAPDARCPRVLPLSGDACDGEGLTCVYGEVCRLLIGAVQCSHGYWTAAGFGIGCNRLACSGGP